jgi:glycosyltransferase involved in cell wall biosynthesis
LTPPGDVAAIAAALRRLAGDRALRLRMGDAARQRLLSGYTEAHVKAALLASYAALLGRDVEA